MALRAYVTGGGPPVHDARDALCVRATTPRRRVRTCGPHTSDAKVSRSTRRRWAAISGLWLG